MSSPRSALVLGAQDALPVLLGIIPFGMIAGVTAVGVGLSPAHAIAMSAMVFAGSSQLAGLQLIGAGAHPFVIFLTTFIINLRFTMYSASLVPLLGRLGKTRKSITAYLLTDQAYAFTIARSLKSPPVNLFWYYLGAAIPVWVVWMVCTVVGVVLGAQIPAEWSLDFTIPLTFMALLFPAMRDRPAVLAAIVAGLAAVLAQGLPYNLGLIGAALAGIITGVMASRGTP